MQRTFDLLTQPLNPSEATTTLVDLSWANARNFVVTPAPVISDHFDVESPVLDGATFKVRVSCKGNRLARFAGVVTCDTDEPDAQPSKIYTWSDLLPGA